MSTLQYQVVKSLEGLTDDNLRFLLNMINCLMKTSEKAGSCSVSGKAERPVGMFKGEKFCADGYDIDEDNDEIAEMFGVTE